MTNRSIRTTVLVAVAAITFAASSRTASAAIAGAQTDTFQDGTTQGWTIGPGGAAPPPTNVSSGGPLGTGDRYLNMTTTNRLAVLNAAQWAGDFLDAGVLDVEVDFRNPNATPLQMRVVLFGPAGGRWTSATPALVPADNAWHHYSFSLRQTDLLNVLSGDTYADTIAGTTQLMLRHDTTGNSGGTPFTGSIGIDNVQAIVPEPAALGLLAALAPFLSRRRTTN